METICFLWLLPLNVLVCGDYHLIFQRQRIRSQSIIEKFRDKGGCLSKPVLISQSYMSPSYKIGQIGGCKICSKISSKSYIKRKRSNMFYVQHTYSSHSIERNKYIEAVLMYVHVHVAHTHISRRIHHAQLMVFIQWLDP